MTYRPSHYATAFLEALRAGTEPRVAIAHLRRALAKRGDAHRLPQVLREIERLEVKSKGGRMITIASARPLSPSQEHALTKNFASPDHVTTEIDPRLIAGVRITIDDERELDLSLTGKLRTLFTH